jgi:hypothetical protein
MYFPAKTVSKSAFYIYGFHVILNEKRRHLLKRVNELIFVTVKCGVFFAVRTEFLSVIYMSLRV